ncbi:Predicted PurR-regulated permease PerM [Cyclobacterium lianum]|uniref:Predicted PurR-regulated permease PerM n=2 Tax=Cyclobacterium lianum TaxID=388280 RepID=A0A1M7KBN3_9BACT|nr:Predicted PurR-regulated permease PerM [Cyclobacterium lianum]
MYVRFQNLLLPDLKLSYSCMSSDRLHPIQLTAYTLISISLVLWLMQVAAFILVPLVWGIFFAFALYPFSNWLENRRFPRSLAIASTLVLVSIAGGAIFYLLIHQMVLLLADIPEIGTKLNEKWADFLQQIEMQLGLDAFSGSDNITLRNWFSFENLNNTLFNTGKSLTLIGIIPLYVFLLLYYKDFFIEFLLKASSRRNEAILAAIADSGQVIHAYLIGMVKVTFLVAIMAGIYFQLIGIKYFLLFALFIAIMNLIPYIGVVISSVLVIFYVFLTSDSFLLPILTLLVLWGIQLLENNLITPLVVGSKVKVNVLAVVLAILIGGGIWGVSGMVLFIPLTGILKITLDRIPSLQPYGYLLGDKFPVIEKNENFIRLLRKKWSGK